MRGPLVKAQVKWDLLLMKVSVHLSQLLLEGYRKGYGGLISKHASYKSWRPPSNFTFNQSPLNISKYIMGKIKCWRSLSVQWKVCRIALTFSAHLKQTA